MTQEPRNLPCKTLHSSLEVAPGGDTDHETVADLAALRLADVRAKLADLARIEGALSKLVGACHAKQGNVSCPLIAALYCH